MSAAQANPVPMVAATALTKVYSRGRERVRALDNVSFEVAEGEFVAIVGPSGCGKTSLLNLLGCMDTPSSGTLRIGGREVQRFGEAERTRFRRDQIGFIFQHFGLLATLSVAENVALPTLFSRREGERDIEELLERVGLKDRRDHRPGELSGGEMQRVAIARALVHRPPLLLADEPTGNLDSATGDRITSLFLELHASGLTLVVATHNVRLAAAAQRQLHLRDGGLSSEALAEPGMESSNGQY